MSDEAATMEPGLEPAGRPSGAIHFSRVIELGHLVQVLAMLLMIGGWALVGYQSITKELDQHQAELDLFKQRQATLEASFLELKNNLTTNGSETRTSLSRIIEQLSDLKAVVAAQSGRLDARHN